MSWGYKILFLYLSFVIAMVAMVVVACRQNIEMQESDYYQKELAYQHTIDAKNNLNRLSAVPGWISAPGRVGLQLPPHSYENIDSGEIRFLRPSDQLLDRRFPLVPDSSGIIYFPRSEFRSGLYQYQLYWKNNDIPYFYENTAML